MTFISVLSLLRKLFSENLPVLGYIGPPRHCLKGDFIGILVSSETNFRYHTNCTSYCTVRMTFLYPEFHRGIDFLTLPFHLISYLYNNLTLKLNLESKT